MSVHLTDDDKNWDLSPVDDLGRPTTYLCYRMLKRMFEEPSRWFASKKLSILLAARYTNTDMICRQLKKLDFLTEDPSLPSHYRYNLNCQNVDLQTGFEKYLVDVQLHHLPVHLMLDYSPSCRWPGDTLSAPFTKAQSSERK